MTFSSSITATPTEGFFGSLHHTEKLSEYFTGSYYILGSTNWAGENKSRDPVSVIQYVLTHNEIDGYTIV